MGGIIIVILWFPLIFILFWIRPLWLLTIDQFLQSYTDIPLPNVLGGIKISTLRGLLFNLHYHPKVLDTWVKSKLETARHEFKKKNEEKKRNIYILDYFALNIRNDLISHKDIVTKISY